jgi:peptidoglycan hydrolase CwlO-like protein
VLQDLEAWLKNPAREIHHLKTKLETATEEIKGLNTELTKLGDQLEKLQSQIDDERAKIRKLDTTVSGLEGENAELRNYLNYSRNLNYVAIGIVVIASVIVVLAYKRLTA